MKPPLNYFLAKRNNAAADKSRCNLIFRSVFHMLFVVQKAGLKLGVERLTTAKSVQKITCSPKIVSMSL